MCRHYQHLSELFEHGVFMYIILTITLKCWSVNTRQAKSSYLLQEVFDAPYHFLGGSSDETSRHAQPQDSTDSSTSACATDGRQQNSCHLCGKVFTGSQWKQKLDRHIKVHTGLKPYQCTFCPHRTNRKDNLRSHILSLHRDSYLTLDQANQSVNASWT